MNAQPEWDGLSAVEVASIMAGEIAERYMNEDENTTQVKEDFLIEYAEKVDAGSVWAPARATLAAKAAWESASDKGRHLASRTIVELAKQLRGETCLPLEWETLPYMVPVGTDRRVSLRTVSSRDIYAMVAIRREKRDEAVKSFSVFESAAELVAASLQPFGDLGTAVENGAFG